MKQCQERLNIRKNLEETKGCTSESVNKWISSDGSDPGFQLLIDDEILEAV